MGNLKEICVANNLNCLILTDGYNIHHISGYRGHTGMLLYFRNDDEQTYEESTQFILTDSRYTEQVTIEANKFACIDIAKDGYSKTLANLIDKYIDKNKVHTIKIGFENNEISYKQFQALKNAFDQQLSYEFVPLDNKVDDFRQIKNQEEIEKIAKAEAIGDQAFSMIVDYISETLRADKELTELEVSLELGYKMIKLGAEGLSFDTIAASGKNSSLPHAMPSNKKLEKGDFLTLDFGCLYQGYCSDMTRTIFIGDKPSEKQIEVYNTVLKAQLSALDMIKPGIKCSDVDKCARDIIAEAGYGDYFGHGLGHSVGLFIHEEPRFSPKCDDILKPGVVITVEPGIYLPGEFGVRIEDTVVVTEDGYENLANSPKELICIA